MKLEKDRLLAKMDNLESSLRQIEENQAVEMKERGDMGKTDALSRKSGKTTGTGAGAGVGVARVALISEKWALWDSRADVIGEKSTGVTAGVGAAKVALISEKCVL